MAESTKVTTRRPVRRRLFGTVAADTCDKTITVVVSYTRPHAKYGKIVRHRSRLHAHDEKNEARVGDQVELTECRRYSKTKAWRLVRVVRAAQRG